MHLKFLVFIYLFVLLFFSLRHKVDLATQLGSVSQIYLKYTIPAWFCDKISSIPVVFIVTVIQFGCCSISSW